MVLLCGTMTALAQTYKDGVWYALYDEEDHVMNTQGDFATGVFAPTAGTLNVQWRYEWIDWLGAFAKIDTKVLESADGGSNTNEVGAFQENTGKNSNTTETFTVSQNINWIKYNRSGLPTHKVIVYHQDIALARHILLASGDFGTKSSTVTFDDQQVLTVSAAQHIDLRSFLTAGDITVTCSQPDIFRLGSATNTNGLSYAVGANACASANGTATNAGGSSLGKIANYGFDVFFAPQEGKSYEALITITDGTSTATVTVRGNGSKIPQTITWEPKTPILSNDTIALAEASSGLAVNYSFSPEGIVTFAEGALQILTDGEVTITASQSGNAQYEAAEPVSRTLTIYPAVVRYAYEQQVCEGDSYTDENFTDLMQAGIYYDTIPSSYGGDSIISLTLIVNPVYHFEDSLVLFVGDSVTWQDIDLSLLPIGDTTLVASYVAETTCDSTYTLYLTIRPRITTYGNDTIELCHGEQAEYEGVIYRRATVDSVLLSTLNEFGGDSIVELVVLVYPQVLITVTDTIREGQELEWEGYDLSQYPIGDTTLVAHYSSIHGCDSTYVLNLTVLINKEGIMLPGVQQEKTADKVIINGRLYIRKGEDYFDALGRKL